MLMVFVAAELVLIPIIGLIWLGIKNENDRKERMLKSCLKALHIISLTRGRHIRGNRDAD